MPAHQPDLTSDYSFRAYIRQRPRFFRVLFALCLTGLALLGYALFIEPNRLVIREYTITPENLPPAFPPLRIAAISDLHFGARFMTLEKGREIVRQVNALQPDLIVILGDFVRNDHVSDSVYVAPELFAQPLGELRAKLGVFAVLGNHDWVYDGEKIRGPLERVGIRFLENDAVLLEHTAASRHARFWLAGISDSFAERTDVRKTLTRIGSNDPVIGITHTPDIFADLPGRFSLLLAGHTHGGQVWFPVLGRLIVPSQYGDRYAIGHITEQSRHLFVTPGLGTSILTVRFCVPPEISVVTVGPQ